MQEKEMFILQAIELAKQNLTEEKGGPFGAVVVKDGKVIGKGSNTVTASKDPTAHAEVNAIRDACKNLGQFQLEDCDIYSSCEPCPMCLGAIYWARPRKLYFAAVREDADKAGFDDSMIYKEINLNKTERTLPHEQLLREEAVKVFDAWIKLENKIQY